MTKRMMTHKNTESEFKPIYVQKSEIVFVLRVSPLPANQRFNYFEIIPETRAKFTDDMERGSVLDLLYGRLYALPGNRCFQCPDLSLLSTYSYFLTEPCFEILGKTLVTVKCFHVEPTLSSIPGLVLGVSIPLPPTITIRDRFEDWLETVGLPYCSNPQPRQFTLGEMFEWYMGEIARIEQTYKNLYDSYIGRRMPLAVADYLTILMAKTPCRMPMLRTPLVMLPSMICDGSTAQLPVMRRSLSHTAEADHNAMGFEDRCMKGDTVLANYWVSNGTITYSYLVKTDRGMVSITDECRVSEFTPDFFAFDACGYTLYEHPSLP